MKYDMRYTLNHYWAKSILIFILQLFHCQGIKILASNSFVFDFMRPMGSNYFSLRFTSKIPKEIQLDAF